MEKRRQSVTSQLSKSYDAQVQRNTKALLSIIDALQYLIKQGLPLRGHNWDKDKKREDGNFSMLIDLLAKHCSELDVHLKTSPQNAKYLSPTIQNDFISHNASLITTSIINQCNSSSFWSIMADETTDVSTVEQLSICVRFLSVCNNEIEVREEFLGFCALPTTTAESITSAMIQFMKNAGLDTNKLVGKGFDGAANMSGHISAVSTRLQQAFPNAKYLISTVAIML